MVQSDASPKSYALICFAVYISAASGQFRLQGVQYDGRSKTPCVSVVIPNRHHVMSLAADKLCDGPTNTNDDFSAVGRSSLHL